MGVRRARTLADACFPEASMPDGAAVDYVRNPPIGQLPGGTDGSIFFVTYEVTEAPDCVAVVAVDATGEAGLALAVAITDGKTADVKAAPTALFSNLADIDFATTPDLKPMAAAVAKKVTDLADQHDHVVDARAVVWTAPGTSGDDLERAKKEVDAILGALKADGTDLGAAAFRVADLVGDSDCPTRLYVVVVEHGIN
jgi:hypothetical protein